MKMMLGLCSAGRSELPGWAREENRPALARPIRRALLALRQRSECLHIIPRNLEKTPCRVQPNSPDSRSLRSRLRFRLRLLPFRARDFFHLVLEDEQIGREHV